MTNPIDPHAERNAQIALVVIATGETIYVASTADARDMIANGTHRPMTTADLK